jgi:hypothetical protein
MGERDGRVIESTQILDNGPPLVRWNHVIVAEGYQESELGQFAIDAQNFVDFMLSQSPFDEFTGAFNVYRLDVASDESGIDDPATCGDNSTGSGAEPLTYFDATLCSNSTRRLLTCDSFLVLREVVIANSPLFGGGSDGPVAAMTRAVASTTMLHEMGHSAFQLADEYEFYQGCGIDTDKDRWLYLEPAQANIAANINRVLIKWRDFINSATALPTTTNPDCSQCDTQTSPVAAGTVGAFEGAGYYHCGLYRPEFSCLMRNSGATFCSVCRTQIRNHLNPFNLPPPAGL